MKKVILLTAVFSLIIFSACHKEEVDHDIVNDQDLVPALTNGVAYSADNASEALFTIGNKDNELLENDALLLRNVPENAVSYYWDFGNGHTSTAAQPSYKYKLHGYYNVTLTITDKEGKIHKGSQEILVLCIFGGGKHDQ